MGRTLGSALTLSTIGLGSKLVVKWLAKKFDVRGLPILLNALKEPDLELSWKKGKGKLVDNVQEKPKLKRRGIVTSECMDVGVADEEFAITILSLTILLYVSESVQGDG